MMHKETLPPTPEWLGGVIYTPADGLTTGLPLLVFLHGAGERGTQTEHLSRHGIPRLVERGKEYPAVVFCPQCPADCVWDNIPHRLKATIEHVVRTYAILPDRILLTGASMGGFGTWMTAMTYPNDFAAIAPISGGGMAWRVGNLATTPVFIAHGDADSLVPPDYSQMMYKACLEAHIPVLFQLYPGLGHNDAIEHAYEDPTIINWLLAQRRTDFSPVPEALSNYF